MKKKIYLFLSAMLANVYISINNVIASPMFLTSTTLETATHDIKALIVRMTNVILAIFCSLVGIIAIVHGFSFAKAEDPTQKQQAKQKLTSLVVAFVLVFVLIVLLNTMSDTLIEWVNGVLGAGTITKIN